MKNIKYVPQGADDTPNHGGTALGHFLPGEVKAVGPGQEGAAKKLVENGEFVETEEAPNGAEVLAKLQKASAEKAAAKKTEPAKPAPAAASKKK